MPKLLFFDLDGTLLDDVHNEVPASVAPALAKAKEHGCLLFLNTGRTMCNLDPRVMALPFDGMILGCGCRIVLRGETLQAMEYSPEESERLRQTVLQSGIPMVYECDTGIFFDPLIPDHWGIEHFRGFATRSGIAYSVTEDREIFRAVKMFGFEPSAEKMQALMDACGEIGMPYQAIPRERTGWEIVPAGCSKAKGIDIIREAVGAELNDCYAFGDSNNDLTMLEHVPHSIAMGNAPEDVQRRCAYVTDRPEADGIAHVLAHLGLLG